MARLREDPRQEQDPKMFAFPLLLIPFPSFAQYFWMTLMIHCRVFKNTTPPLSFRLGLSSVHICKAHLRNVPDIVAAQALLPPG